MKKRRPIKDFLKKLRRALHAACLDLGLFWPLRELRHRRVLSLLNGFSPAPATRAYLKSQPLKIDSKALQWQPQRKNLIFVRAGTDSVHRNWRLPIDRSWDLIACYHDSGAASDQVADLVISGGGNKLHGFKSLLAVNPSVMDYETFWFLDDDLVFDTPMANQVFDAMKEHGLALGQPALTADSFATFDALRQRQWPFGHIPEAVSVSYIEVMCPLFSQAALRTLLPTFELAGSLWAVDMLWPYVLDSDSRLAIINRHSVNHIRPIDIKGGPFYTWLKSFGVSAWDEGTLIRKHFKI